MGPSAWKTVYRVGASAQAGGNLSVDGCRVARCGGNFSVDNLKSG